MLNYILKNLRTTMMKLILSILSFLILSFSFGQGSYQLAVLKYSGGGDYYANPTSVPNLVKFVNQQLNANINTEVPYVDVGSPLLFTYPFVHMTGHGNVVFSNVERENLRNYLIGGGFLHIDDNYGMDQYIRPELEKLFPNFDLVELPYDHPIFNQKYKFHGLPKIHEHDRSEEHTSELQSRPHLVCRLLLEKKKNKNKGQHNQKKKRMAQSFPKHVPLDCLVALVAFCYSTCVFETIGYTICSVSSSYTIRAL